MPRALRTQVAVLDALDAYAGAQRTITIPLILNGAVRRILACASRSSTSTTLPDRQR
jgi:hypothetical protein